MNEVALSFANLQFLELGEDRVVELEELVFVPGILKRLVVESGAAGVVCWYLVGDSPGGMVSGWSCFEWWMLSGCGSRNEFRVILDCNPFLISVLPWKCDWRMVHMDLLQDPDIEMGSLGAIFVEIVAAKLCRGDTVFVGVML